MEKVKIEKLVFGGQGLGRVKSASSADHAASKAVFVWGALPGEEVEVELTKNKVNFAEGIAVKILKPSSEHLAPRESHYLSCSPWQIMNFEAENKWKVEIAKETYKKLAGLDWGNPEGAPLGLEIATDGVEYGYRNKMEYSFTLSDNETTPSAPGGHPSFVRRGQATLAFHVRESRKYVPIEVCELARPEINEVALRLLAWINRNKIPLRSLKTMIVRSNQKGEVIAGLFLKDRLQFVDYPELKDNLLGLTIYYSTHKSPASVPTDILYQIGRDYLEEDLFGAKLRYGLFSFFQINIPVFKMALQDIKKFIDSNDNIIDYYCGVGAIGLSAGAQELIESNNEAADYAKINIGLNKAKAEAICAPSEKMLDLIAEDKTIIFDPPRAGLDKRIVERLLKIQPKKIIYLSCDLATQARDIGMLKEKYELKFLKLYNFFPRTAHVEGLAVLVRN